MAGAPATLTRIALLSSEPLRARMAGIGIRYLELARRLPRPSLEVVVFTPGDPGEVPEVPCEVRAFDPACLPGLLSDCDAVVAQGQLANDLLLAGPDVPVAIDLYDPWLVENLSYLASLGLDPYRNDHATWVLQMSRGDFFLCSSEEQRLFYLGFLAALGRVNPVRVEQDPDARDLIATVPFGVPDEVPEHRPFLEPAPPGTFTILFGGLYDWYDPWTLLAALEGLPDPDWRLLFVESPNPESTPQELLGEVEGWCRRHSWWNTKVRSIPWVPADRRYDLLRDVDLLAAPHRPSLETRLSLRTRYLDALAVGRPVLLTQDGTIARLVVEHEAGWVVPPGSAEAVRRALMAVRNETPEAAARRQRGAAALLAERSWDRALEPLVAFCLEPRVDSTKEGFAFRPPTTAPEEATALRLRRLRRRMARWWRRAR
jgi:glycosyltransferase involved in cell wall biosynthesis